MELWLIRHALPVRIDAGPAPADPDLAAGGHEQAGRLAEWWAPFGVDALHASPMRRAHQTAEPLAAALGAPIATVEDLKEFDAHLPTYIPIEELRADAEAWRAAVAAWMSPEAEALRLEFRDRVVAAIDEVARAGTAEGLGRAAVVCHGGVINAYLSKVLNLPGTMFFEPAYTSVSRVLSDGEHRQLVSINETPHLGHPVLPSITL